MRYVVVLAAALMAAPPFGGALRGETLPKPIPAAVLDFDFVDTSGESEDQSADHARRLRNFSEELRRDLAASGKYRIVPTPCGSKPCSSRDEPDELRRTAQSAGARLVILGGLHKMSTLVQWAKIQIFDVDDGRIVFDRLLTFRGDTDESWRRSEHFVSREIVTFAR